MSERITCGHMHNIMTYYGFNESSREKFSYYTRIPGYDHVSINIKTGCVHPNDILGNKSTKVTVDGVMEIISGQPRIAEIKYIGRTGGSEPQEMMNILIQRVNEAKQYITDNLSKKRCKDCEGTVSVREGCLNKSCISKIKTKTISDQISNIFRNQEDPATPKQKKALENYSRVYEFHNVKRFVLGREIIDSMTLFQAKQMLDLMAKEWDATIKGKISPGQFKYLKAMMDYLRKKRYKTDIISDEDLMKLEFTEATGVIKKIAPLYNDLKARDAQQSGAVRKIRKEEVESKIAELINMPDELLF